MLETLVMTSLTNWEEPPRIRHQIAVEMKKYFKTILFVELPNYHALTQKKYVSLEPRPVDDNIFALRIHQTLTLPKNGQSLIPMLSEYLQRKTLKKIKESLFKLKLSEPILLNFNYTSYLLEDPETFIFSTFLLNDDFINKAPTPFIRHLAEWYQRKTAERADCCLAVSIPLVHQLEKINKNTRLFIPGHSFKPFNSQESVSARKEKKNKIIQAAFMGFINRRVDLEWIKHASRQKDIEFTFIGPNQLANEKTNELKKLGIKFLPPLYGEELFTFLRSCDVLTIPYVLSKEVLAITASNKLFQYIASGRPVVVSNMPYFLPLPPEVVVKAETKEDFTEKIRIAFKTDCTEFEKERLKVADANTWEKRGQELNAIFEKTLFTAVKINRNLK